MTLCLQTAHEAAFPEGRIQYASINHQEQLSNGFLNDINQARVKCCHRSIVKGLLLNLTILVLGTSPLLECCVSIEANVILPFQACNFAFMAGFFGLKHRDLVRKIVLFTAEPNNIYYFPSGEHVMNHS